jgi:hypothetical protein
LARPSILIPFLLAAVAAGCGGSSGGGDPVVITPPRPTAAIATANQIYGLAGSPTAENLSARTGTATLTGLIAADLTSGGQSGSRAIMGQSNLTVNFGSGAVTGSATNFAEVVSSTSGGQITVSKWVQSMTGSLTQSGTLTHGAGGSGMTLTTTGNLAGTMVINGQAEAGSYRIDATGNGLSFQRKGPTTYAVGGPGSGLPSDLEVTFTPTGGGAPIRVCIDNLCPASGPGLGAVHILQVQ